ncbi:Hypothetical protein SCF082_LOCUS5592 [Durusdinium trenchii]|uniref:C3H1-type domain-containing protein n=1 Tax=Durusdinium trenchii TaxID=1381693 RepID=A0ABP0I6X2_9DINO
MMAQPRPIRIAELLGSQVHPVGMEKGPSDFEVDYLAPKKVLPSVGSVLHGRGCKPCAWFWKAQGCKNGRECLHCHLCTSKEARNRKKQMALVKRLGVCPRPPPGLLDEENSPLSSTSGRSLQLDRLVMTPELRCTTEPKFGA